MQEICIVPLLLCIYVYNHANLLVYMYMPVTIIRVFKANKAVSARSGKRAGTYIRTYIEVCTCTHGWLRCAAERHHDMGFWQAFGKLGTYIQECCSVFITKPHKTIFCSRSRSLAQHPACMRVPLFCHATHRPPRLCAPRWRPRWRSSPPCPRRCCWGKSTAGPRCSSPTTSTTMPSGRTTTPSCRLERS